METQEHTRRSRIEIGFSPRESWRAAPAEFKEHCLTIQGHPVMEDWEDGYMRQLAEIACSNGGTVLEIGFGMGIAAEYIQAYDISTHVIIEANTDVFARLVKFSEDAYRTVIPLHGFWEDLIRDIPSGSIDGILFDTYPLSEDEIHQNHFAFFKEAYRILATDGVLTYYSDEAVDFSRRHRMALMEAGFTDIDGEICAVSPPEDCQYWRNRTLLAPIIRK